jgi:flavin reductase (DIM6/NTAB) family NADH-FMN oxidoreductase RutF
MDQTDPHDEEIVDLPTGGPELWERVFTVAPLVLIGTSERDGAHDLAPKHQAMPLGWADHYGFVCTPRHRTHANLSRTREFTVSFPQPDQVVAVGQAAAPRIDGDKLPLMVLPTRPGSVVDAPLVEGAALWLECELERTVAGFGEHELVVGRIVAASAPWWALRSPDVDDAELIAGHPQLVHLSPSRFASVARTHSFPFPAEFTR